MKFLYILALELLAIISKVQSESTDKIDYNVIALLNSSELMTVIVDNQAYPLKAKNNNVPILLTANAPISTSGYRYAKVNLDRNTSTFEPFMRPPVNSSTPNEFFMRSWNRRHITPLPRLYQPLKPINRVESDLHTDGEIPTIHIRGDQDDFDSLHQDSEEDIRVTSNITYLGFNSTFLFYDAEVSLAGRSSRWMPKLSYNVRFNDKDLLYQYKKIKLRALSTDPSYIREQLAYDSVDSVGLVSSGFSYCRVFLNDQELGLFGLMENFQDTWLSNVFNNGREYANGRLYQGVFSTPESAQQGLISDLSFVDNVDAYSQGQYKLKDDVATGKRDNFKPLMALTKFLNVDAPMNGTGVIKAWNKKFNTESFLRSMALEVLLGFSDGYLAMADNFYVYEEPKSKQFFYIPSDMDMTYGNTMFPLEDMWSGNYSTFPGIHERPILSRMLQIPEFKQRYEELLVDFANNLINPSVMHDRIYDLHNMLQEDVVWDKSLPRVSNGESSVLGNMNGNNDESDHGFASRMNMTILSDLVNRINASIPFMTAINGPTGHVSLAGVNEWLFNQLENTDRFFNTTPVDL